MCAQLTLECEKGGALEYGLVDFMQRRSGRINRGRLIGIRPVCVLARSSKIRNLSCIHCFRRVQHIPYEERSQPLLDIEKAMNCLQIRQDIAGELVLDLQI